jgi:hypothetical protein
MENLLPPAILETQSLVDLSSSEKRKTFFQKNRSEFKKQFFAKPQTPSKPVKPPKPPRPPKRTWTYFTKSSFTRTQDRVYEHLTIGKRRKHLDFGEYLLALWSNLYQLEKL